MSDFTRLSAQITDFSISLREEGLPHHSLPESGSMPRYYAVWFAAMNYLFQTYPEPQRPISSRLASSLNEIFNTIQDITGFFMPGIKEGASVSAAGHLFSVGAAATGGEVWCGMNHSSGVALRPMNIIRYDTPEFRMTCHEGDVTEYVINNVNDSLDKQ